MVKRKDYHRKTPRYMRLDPRLDIWVRETAKKNRLSQISVIESALRTAMAASKRNKPNKPNETQ